MPLPKRKSFSRKAASRPFVASDPVVGTPDAEGLARGTVMDAGVLRPLDPPRREGAPVRGLDAEILNIRAPVPKPLLQTLGLSQGFLVGAVECDDTSSVAAGNSQISPADQRFP